MNGRKIAKWDKRPGQVGWVDQEEFERIAAEATAWHRYARGEHGRALSCPLKKVS